MRIEKLAQEYDIAIKKVYFPLHMDCPPEGTLLAEMFGGEAKVKGMIERLQPLFEAEGLDYGLDHTRTYDDRLAQELAKWGETTDKAQELEMAIFKACMVDYKNIGLIEVLLPIVADLGLPVLEARDVLESRAMQKAVEADWDHAMESGVKSIPTFLGEEFYVPGAQSYDVLVKFAEHLGAKKR